MVKWDDYKSVILTRSGLKAAHSFYTIQKRNCFILEEQYFGWYISQGPEGNPSKKTVSKKLLFSMKNQKKRTLLENSDESKVSHNLS